MLGKNISLTIILGIMVTILAGIVRWLNISIGSLVDWIIAIASFWWLLTIVTIPWNIHFDARETLNNANLSQDKGIPVDAKQLKYVRQIARWSIVVAIALHLLSALALYVLAITGISNVGYISSGLTLLLTILRPTIRGYQYLNQRLLTIKKEVECPRQDAIEFSQEIEHLKTKIEFLENLLDLENPNSLVKQQQESIQENRRQIALQKALLEEERAKNTVEHQRISQEAIAAVSQLTEDSQFLSHVREIIRFVKTA